MDAVDRFRAAVTAWAAGGAEASAAEAEARRSAPGIRRAVLVEGRSDRAAVEALAARRGRDLAAEGVAVVPLGGAMSIGHFLDVCGPPGLDLPLAGLCDLAEEGYFRRHLERVGLGPVPEDGGLAALGFHVCAADLEDELIRALGPHAVTEVIGELGEARPFRTFRGQPAQRDRPVERQLRRFFGTHSGRKELYAGALVARLGPTDVPRPLARLMAAL
ncbi:TOPRIM nucleotidyl transferase/hydrolase domain-containing protein [Streptomyces sp. NPDC097619]|uniref:TOPRIM nucleotidyl transferase/hydrolase domain-containing protein n=1 Tax=Streptomyces sp. NPDC097619 TaxID=3157228 RepID=UPI003326ED6A